MHRRIQRARQRCCTARTITSSGQCSGIPTLRVGDRTTMILAKEENSDYCVLKTVPDGGGTWRPGPQDTYDVLAGTGARSGSRILSVQRTSMPWFRQFLQAPEPSDVCVPSLSPGLLHGFRRQDRVVWSSRKSPGQPAVEAEYTHIVHQRIGRDVQEDLAGITSPESNECPRATSWKPMCKSAEEEANHQRHRQRQQRAAQDHLADDGGFKPELLGEEQHVLRRGQGRHDHHP